ncbi:unnamed protein product, partial [Mycena citricolor]
MPVALGKKRKSDSGLPSTSKNPPKKPRQTLDSFFAPRVLAPASAHADDRRPVALNSEQAAILRQVVDEGRSVFFTGSAGPCPCHRVWLRLSNVFPGTENRSCCALSSLLSKEAWEGRGCRFGHGKHRDGSVEHRRDDYPRMGCRITHPSEFEFQIRCIKKCRPALKRWQKTKVLIIDEGLIYGGRPLFTRICKIAEHLRKNESPFGGIQLVITGTFFQLPPVSKNGAPVFAFEVEEWGRCIDRTLTLSKFSGRGTMSHVICPRFVNLLNQLRLGNITSAAAATFKTLERPLPPDPAGILPTELFPLRSEVDKANSARLAALTTEKMAFTSRDTGTAPADKRAKLLESMMAPAS